MSGIRKQAFMHYHEQPYKDLIEKTYEVAPKVDIAQSSENDPHNQRKSDVSWILPGDDTNQLFEFLSGIAHAANDQANWHFDTPILEPLQFTEYKVGQKYDWHVDQLMGELEETIRKISFTVLLNDEFEGGELQIEAGSPANAERHHTIDMKKGDICFFPSHLWHRVTPVTKGVRHSLVGWFRGPQWR